MLWRAAPPGSPAAASTEGIGVKRYTVKVNGITTTLRLSDEDAARRGLTAPEPDSVQKSVPVPTKAKRPANKARRPSNKQAEIAAAAFRPKPKGD